MAATGDKSRPGLRRSAELREHETASGRLVADALMIMRRNPLAKQIPRNQHDILTGSDSDGRAYTDGYDHTCNNWTSDAMAYPQTNPNVPADRARAMIGHSDRSGQNTSWISSHLTQGCSKQALINTGGAGHLYCFAIN